jgi:hypothetical protein
MPDRAASLHPKANRTFVKGERGFRVTVVRPQIPSTCNIPAIAVRSLSDQAIFFKFQEKFSFVASVGNMPYITWKMMSIRPCHL